MTAAIVKEKVELDVADGTRMAAYVARPGEGGPTSGAAGFQEAFGGEPPHTKRGRAICGGSYVAIAPELFHRSAPPGFEGSYTDFPAVMPHCKR